MAAVVIVASGCAPPRPPLPQSRDAWLLFDVDVPGRDSRDLLRRFVASAQAFGCSTENAGGWSTGTPGGGWARFRSTIVAQCDEGTIAMTAVGNERVRLSCPKPATRERCEALLNEISLAR
jgi:hypothetical protein